jgi:arylsulfatase A-like enzyme
MLGADMQRIAYVMCAVVMAAVATAAEPVRKPNVVYMLADDIGWSDVSIHPGGTIQTPHIDALFRAGVELTQFMGWCVCSPTRAMLLTGRHPFRIGTGPEVGGELDPAETTIAEVFQAAGYRTGVFGKWHNGEDPPADEFTAAFREAFKAQPHKKLLTGHGANAHGFDDAWVYYGGGADFFTRRIAAGRGPVSWWHNREYRPHDEGYTEDLIVERALEFVRASRDRPFFCYIPFHLIHAPMQAKQSDLAAVPTGITDPDKRTYAAMVRGLDRNVGRVLATLDELGLRDDTVVVFTSDNGATPVGSNLPLRGSKHTVHEGGTRLPTAIHWPRGGLAGGRRWDGLCGGLDMLPTLAALAGIEPKTRPLDGRSIWPAVRDGAASPVESYYWAWHDCDCVRTDRWRMHRFFDRVTLYDIQADIGESRNLAAEQPDVVRDLTARLDAWATSLQAALSHRPPSADLDAPPAPEGDVLEIRVPVTTAAKPKDMVVIPFASPDITQVATDHVEYDVLVGDETPARAAWFYSPFRNGRDNQPLLSFRRGMGIDQFGREQVTGPPVRGGAGVWEHRVIGLCGIAPGQLPRNAVVVCGVTPGTHVIYLDNVRLRHADGSRTPIWTKATDTGSPKIADTEAFRDVRVRVVPRERLP